MAVTTVIVSESCSFYEENFWFLWFLCKIWIVTSAFCPCHVSRVRESISRIISPGGSPSRWHTIFLSDLSSSWASAHRSGLSPWTLICESKSSPARFQCGPSPSTGALSPFLVRNPFCCFDSVLAFGSWSSTDRICSSSSLARSGAPSGSFFSLGFDSISFPETHSVVRTMAHFLTVESAG
jgi:hypothetical protein